MYFSDNLMVGESLLDEDQAKVNSIIDKLKSGVGTISVFIVALSDPEGPDLFDIYNAMIFKQKALRRLPIWVVGLAGSEEEARSLATDYICELVAKGKADTLKKEVLQYFQTCSKEKKC